MSVHVRILLWGAVALLGAAAVRGGLPARGGRGARPWVAAGFLALSAGLFARGVATGSCPLGNGCETGVFIVWAALAAWLLAGGFAGRGDAAAGGLAAAGLAGTLLFLNMDAPRTPGTGWVSFHAGTALLGYGALGAAGAAALLYLALARRLRARGFPGDNLPPVRTLDRALPRLVAAGTLLLGAGMAAGAIALARGDGNAGAGKLAAGSVVLLGWAGALVLRLRERLLAARFAWVCVAWLAASVAALAWMRGK